VNCAQTQNLLHAYVDGELDLVRSLEFEHHIADCAACAETLKANQALHTALASASLYHRAPAGLQARILADAGASSPSAPSPHRLRPHHIRIAVAASLAFFALGLLGAIGLILARYPPAADQLAQDAVSSHIRSLQVAHLTDIASSDNHAVKPWFDAWLDFSPAVIDLKEEGFPLTGGRLDYLENRPVAALVYQRRKHAINLFTWPSTRTVDSEMRTRERHGYHLVEWSQRGMTYCAVSNLNETELKQFGELLRQQLAVK